MQFLKFKEELKGFPLFNLNDIRKIDEEFDLRRLSEWQKKGYILKLRRGHYTFSGGSFDEDTLFLLANRLYPHSYVSLESALAHHSLIPEGVYSVTSVTTNKTIHFETPASRFEYRNVRSALLFGYQLLTAGDTSYKIAEPEKTVLDYIYFHPEVTTEKAFREWRFNVAEFNAIANISKMRSYAQLFENKTFSARVERFLHLLQH